MENGIQLRIKGKVQGVGFRPYIWQLAHQCHLYGDVCNDGEGVLVRLCAGTNLSEFIQLLHQHCPPLAHIESVQSSSFQWQILPESFTIRRSGEGRMDTQVIPDAATCDACLQELFTPSDRRFHYPFTNCTHCGPRFTIIRHMPYDRPNTAMANFPLCAHCLSEYQSPADRRFHAQPNACAQCGPEIKLCDGLGQTLAQKEDALLLATEQILLGKIIAIKGLGGFHLACDATNDDAVKQLRQRKRRPTKPFAVMVPSIGWLEDENIKVNNGLKALLKSPAAPIVLIHKWANNSLSAAVAPELTELGVMLPSNPLQHLLMAKVKRPLIMTSGNASGKPPVLTEADAFTDLANVADFWLTHNRDIVQRADDSLVRYHDGQAEMLRRARGYVPDALALPKGFENAPSILGLGADLKNTFCLLRGNSAVMSQHFGDLDDMDICQQYQDTITLFESIYRFIPSVIVGDMHPNYVSYRYGETLAQQRQIPFIKVQHHHAHIAAVMVEHGLPLDGSKVIGLALDGLGYGDDNRLWGGECLLVDYNTSQHLGGLPPVALPGGELASRQPWRNLLAHWLQFVPQWQQQEMALQLKEFPWQGLQKAIQRGVNSPVASSVGRLFDAVAAALGICTAATSWEGEAACQLEALASQCDVMTHPVSMPLIGQQLDLKTFWQQWVAYQAPKVQRAHAFHVALAQGFAELARKSAHQYGIHRIVLSGGVIHNQLLRRLLVSNLNEFDVLYAKQLPMGDGGLSLGQVAIAAARLKV
ncbi:carbamoyltransferase HypF [Providencia alcalifaciens]|uniref:carbamoyltransferase HypF n=1 Tax=Providencia TaxID=586 RepID=UPI0018E8352D|nr:MULTISPECIES: carbamoyltransferase HypF [Providencia]EJD6080010.1 carbamoyltransferase HypF [Providencia rettgeri]MBQ0330340.1 carbamoyltransferase HypF [Providencia rettgeri]MBQ0686498.1 carbamoyltransferase HypF [Providencia rettgeri]QQE92617.1 carbamoyltransferase HypF [Providencia rettgeri]QWJ91077.1 carbamoyltransferase HypF [Providencia rettgeri]